jgi:hypothetical protein
MKQKITQNFVSYYFAKQKTCEKCRFTVENEVRTVTSIYKAMMMAAGRIGNDDGAGKTG